MDSERSAATLGIAACIAVLATAGAPYLVGRPTAVGPYYDAGAAGPPLVALFAAVVAVVLAAGVSRRTDPSLAAGIAVAVGAIMALLAWDWALAVEPSLVGGFTAIDAFRHHRWLFASVTLLVTAAGGWYARAVLS